MLELAGKKIGMSHFFDEGVDFLKLDRTDAVPVVKAMFELTQEKGKETKNIWFYNLKLERNLGKTNPLSEKDLEEFISLQSGFLETKYSWNVNIKDIDKSNYDLSIKNPNIIETPDILKPEQILDTIEQLNYEENKIIKNIKEILKK